MELLLCYIFMVIKSIKRHIFQLTVKINFGDFYLMQYMKLEINE